ncbi:MAG: type IV secretion protein Rhs [Muribaculaceae bacterium]|nr:type IV secretion protein Rhs [Muribaculaceae bacterium]
MEKFLKSLFLVLITLTLSVSMTACGGDDDDDEPANLSSRITGTYVGELTSGGYVIDDTYTVYVGSVSNTVVSVTAKLFTNGSANFNVEKSGNAYVLKSVNQSNMNITIQGRSMTINFLNNAGTMTTFIGTRD